jgi:hypothetical protein
VGDGVGVAVGVAIGVVLFLAISANRRSRPSRRGASSEPRTNDGSVAQAGIIGATALAGATMSSGDNDPDPAPDSGGSVDGGSWGGDGGSWGGDGGGGGGDGGGGSS